MDPPQCFSSGGNTYRQTVMPPDSRSVPRSSPVRSVILPTVSLDVLEDALAKLHEALGGRRHPDLASDPQEQRLAQLFFEQQNLAADRRLRHVQLPAARGERTGFGNRLEDFELAKIHRPGRFSVSCPSKPCGRP